MDEKVVARFWAKVNKDGPVHPVLGTRCWVWMAGKNRLGYGKFGIRQPVKKTLVAHRVAFELSVGPADGLIVCHHCDNPSCVNPGHLFLGTHKTNAEDRDAKGRGRPCGGNWLRGERHGNAQLTDTAVDELRTMARTTGNISATARAFGLSKSQAWRICTGKSRQAPPPGTKRT